MRQRRSRCGTPKDRAVSTATGSTSRTPYIVCTRMGQKAPKAARKTSLLSVGPSVRKSNGFSAADGIGRRNSTGTRNARPARSLRPSTTPMGTARSVASPSPIAQPRAVWRNAVQKLPVWTSAQSSSIVAVIEGRSCSRTTPLMETACQKTSAKANESTKTTNPERRGVPVADAAGSGPRRSAAAISCVADAIGRIRPSAVWIRVSEQPLAARASTRLLQRVQHAHQRYVRGRLLVKTPSRQLGCAWVHRSRVRRSPRLARGLQRAPDALAVRRHLDVPDAERRERVHDRALHCRRGADRARLADPLRAQ